MPTAWNPDGENWVDYGLGGYLKSAGHAPEVYVAELGKFKVPTLRNVDLRPSEDFVKAYGHNGYFKSLDDIVFFYHWRAMMGNCMGGGMGGGGMMGCEGMAGMFPAPEVDQNLATLKMFPMMQIDNIVAFLKTLSDGFSRDSMSSTVGGIPPSHRISIHVSMKDRNTHFRNCGPKKEVQKGYSISRST